MKIQSYTYPKSSFLSTEKDMNIIVDRIMKNERLKKMLFYTSRDCLDRPKLTPDETHSLFGKQIKIVPKLYVDGSVLNYIIISFDNFTPNETNPEFRDCNVVFDIISHTDYWALDNYQIRPLKIAGYIDGILNNAKLSGIGEFHFLGCSQLVLSEDLSG
mgnify:CR=1 FL=1